MGNDRRSTVDHRIDRAVALVCGRPLRWSDRDGGCDEESVLARGWFRGANECARTLAFLTQVEPREGLGFGGRWPILEVGTRTLAPALPVAVSGKRAAGADGEYRRDSSGVWREARGAEDLFLAPGPSRPPPGAPFDLLWFGDFERFVVSDGTLAIEDLFGVLRTPASPQVLDHLLIRSRRLEEEILDEVPMIDQRGPQTVEVRRPEDLSSDDRWRDASVFLNARADLTDVSRRGETIEAQSVGGTTAIFQLAEDDDGWLLILREGGYVFSEIRAAHRAKAISLCATLDSGFDAMAPGMRGRLVFDLRADLVTLGGP